MNNQTSIQRYFVQVEEAIAAGQQLESARTTEEALLHYNVALAILEVLAAGTNEKHRLQQLLAHVHDRLGRIYLVGLDCTKAANHLEAAVVGYDRLFGGGNRRSFEMTVLLAEACVRGGQAVAGQAAAKAAAAVLEQVEGYCSPSAAYAYYWLYRSEMMLENQEAAAAAATKMGAYLVANPDLLNNGTFGLLLREVATLKG
jgi:hypothetical protein